MKCSEICGGSEHKVSKTNVWKCDYYVEYVPNDARKRLGKTLYQTKFLNLGGTLILRIEDHSPSAGRCAFKRLLAQNLE